MAPTIPPPNSSPLPPRPSSGENGADSSAKVTPPARPINSWEAAGRPSHGWGRCGSRLIDGSAFAARYSGAAFRAEGFFFWFVGCIRRRPARWSRKPRSTTIANNLANVNTAGFKRTLLQIQSQPQRDLYRFQTDPGRTPGARIDGVADAAGTSARSAAARRSTTRPPIFEQGAIATTGNDLDVALSGPGFFASARRNTQVRYTRDGASMRDANGLLTRPERRPRAGPQPAPPIALPAQGKIGIDARRHGQRRRPAPTPSSAWSSSRTRPRCGPRARTASSTPAPAARAATNTTALQGSLEKSNADVVRSMVDLITDERWFDANEKIIQTQDDANGSAISTVGRTQA